MRLRTQLWSEQPQGAGEPGKEDCDAVTKTYGRKVPGCSKFENMDKEEIKLNEQQVLKPSENRSLLLEKYRPGVPHGM